MGCITVYNWHHPAFAWLQPITVTHRLDLCPAIKPLSYAKTYVWTVDVVHDVFICSDSPWVFAPCFTCEHSPSLSSPHIKGFERGFPGELLPVHPAALNICLLIWRKKQGCCKRAWGGGSGRWGGGWCLGGLLYISARVTVSLGLWRGELGASSSFQTSGSW